MDGRVHVWWQVTAWLIAGACAIGAALAYRHQVKRERQIDVALAARKLRNGMAADAHGKHHRLTISDGTWRRAVDVAVADEIERQRGGGEPSSK